MYSWGLNEKGQLGQNDTEARSVPCVVSGIGRVSNIAAGADFCIGIGAIEFVRKGKSDKKSHKLVPVSKHPLLKQGS